MAWEGRKRPTQADHHLPATATSLFKSSANGFLQRKHSQRIASFFMVKNLDQETTMPKAQWKVFWRYKRGRPMEGRPRTSTLSLSLPLVYSLILNGIVIFYVF